MQGVLGNQVKPGSSLDALLRSHFAAHTIQEAVCTWCSLKWTLLEHQQDVDQRPSASLRHPGSINTDQQNSASQEASIPKDHLEPQLPCQPCNPSEADPKYPKVPCEQHAHSRTPEQQPRLALSASSIDVEPLGASKQGLAQLPEADVDSMAQLPCQHNSCSKAPVQQPQGAAISSCADVRLLEGCLLGTCPLPEADVQSMAERAGMRWVQRRGTLLARTLIAQAPQVFTFHSTFTSGSCFPMLALLAPLQKCSSL